MSAKKLKCPYCKGGGDVTICYTAYTDLCYLCCDECGARGPLCATEEAARESWRHEMRWQVYDHAGRAKYSALRLKQDAVEHASASQYGDLCLWKRLHARGWRVRRVVVLTGGR